MAISCRSRGSADRGSTGEEAKVLLKAARSDRLFALYAVALALGLRRGEALALRWQDVDLVDGVLFVRQPLQRLNGRLVFGPVKSDESERVIGLPAPCLAALRQHKLAQEAERKTMGDRWQDFGLVFPPGSGRRSNRATSTGISSVSSTLPAFVGCASMIYATPA